MITLAVYMTNNMQHAISNSDIIVFFPLTSGFM